MTTVVYTTISALLNEGGIPVVIRGTTHVDHSSAPNGVYDLNQKPYNAP